MLLYYIRHGKPTYNPDELVSIGKRQAEAVGRRLALNDIDEIYASSSNRAIQTAQPLCDILEKELTVLDWANESYAWDEMSIVDENGCRKWCVDFEKYRRLFSNPEVLALGKKWYEHECFADTKFGEGVKRVLKESDEFLLSLGYKHNYEENCYECVKPNDKKIALFAHHGFGMLFLSTILDLPYPYVMNRMDMSHTGVTVISFANDKFTVPILKQLSDLSHIYAEDLPMKYNGSFRI